ncbi:PilZ domain-containing protein [Thiorhodovibrio frisius]|uniref:PilZ domain-containing protein n=1 Tax=Thiorhodovibrio frisius TaxID=631362 RepID=H8Z4D5_9GAMM|nr:PilZ domain-containing protein [Thiorhodovibrio frisius]EIC20192.1 PilZ domain-containing protein [Thiorhodovibrio frisius]WPL20930.1 PilZ domain protein [Thiorhodovibrio frisius]
MTVRAITDELTEAIKTLDPQQKKKLLAIVKQWRLGHQRHYDRFEQESADVAVACNGRICLGQAKNISASGIFITIDHNFFPPSDIVDLVFSLPGVDQPFKLKGRIVRLTEDGIAVEFVKVTPSIARTLDSTLRIPKAL